jgi:hypothetical protein
MTELSKIHNYVNASLKIEIKQNTRKRNIVDGRFLFFAIARETTDLSLERIGMYLNKDHASVIHGVNMFNDVLTLDKKFNTLYNVYINDNWVEPDAGIDEVISDLKQKISNLEVKNINLELKLKEKVPFLEDYYKLDYKERETVKERLNLIIKLMPSNQQVKESTKYEKILCSQ